MACAQVLAAIDILQPPSAVEAFHEIYVMCELMQSDLHRIIVSPQPLSADHVKIFLYQILRGTLYLHSAKIIHRCAPSRASRASQARRGERLRNVVLVRADPI